MKFSELALAILSGYCAALGLLAMTVGWVPQRYQTPYALTLALIALPCFPAIILYWRQKRKELNQAERDADRRMVPKS